MSYHAQEAIKRILARASHQSGLTQLVRRLADHAVGPRLLILMYHRIAETPDRFHQALSTQAFTDQIAHVAKHYPCLTEQEVCAYLNGQRPLSRTSIMVTFDDGYRDTATIAQPVLRRHGVPSTVFLATSAIGTGQALWPDRLGEAFKTTSREQLAFDGRPGLPAQLLLRNLEERVHALRLVTEYCKLIPQMRLEAFVSEVEQRLGVSPKPYDGMLSWDEVIHLNREGMAVGGHTIHHQTLSRLPLEQAREEIVRSKAEIEQRLGHSLMLFCYPNGTFSDITPAVKRLVRQAGFVAAVAAEEGANDHHSDLFSLLRVPAYQRHVPRFAGQLIGAQLLAPKVDALPTGFHVEVVDTEARWDELESAWKTLAEQTQARSIFLSWEWLRTWWEVFGAGKRLWILAVWHPDGRLIGLAPWYRRTERVGGVIPSRVIRWIGDGEPTSTEYQDVLARPEDAADVAQALGQCLLQSRKTWDVALLRRVWPQSVGLQRLQEILGAAGSASVRLEEPLPCPYVELPATWDAYFSQLSANMKHNLQRRRKKLDKELPHNAFIVGAPGGDVREGLRLIREIHLKRKATQGIASPFAQTAYLEFHQRLAQRLEREGRVYLSFLSINETPVAAQYGFRDDGTLYAYQICFDPAYGKYGVAQLLLGRIIQSEIERGTRRLDFLRGNESYKYDWTQTEHRLSQLEVAAPSLCGRTAWLARRGRARAGRWLRARQEQPKAT